jgi:hypothetical protein
MGDTVHTFGLNLCWDRLDLESTELQSMCDTVHPSRMMIMRIALYKSCFGVCVTNGGLNRKDVYGQDRRIHA